MGRQFSTLSLGNRAELNGESRSLKPSVDYGKAEIKPREPVPSPVSGQIKEPAAEEPSEVILRVVSDLDGLLTPAGLVLLLTAAPGDIVPFSDHELFASLHDVLTTEDMEALIQEAIQAGHLGLSPHQRLVIKE